MPESLTNDKFCEELSHPHLFPSGNLGFKQREKYDSHHRNILISDCQITHRNFLLIQIAYLLPSQSYKSLILSYQINIAMRKVTSNQLTTGMFSVTLVRK